MTGNAVHESHCSVQCFVQGYVIKDESDCRVLLFFYKASKKRPRSLEVEAHMTALLCQRMRFGVFRALNILNGYV